MRPFGLGERRDLEERPTVLVIEDSRFFQVAVSRGLAKVLPNVDCILAGNLADGLEILKRHSDRIVCVLLDLHLPDASEGEAVEPVEAFGKPMVIFTGTAAESLREDLISPWIVDYVYKGSSASLDYVAWIVRRLYRNATSRVLVVDDSRSARSHLRGMLEACRFSVDEAESGEEGLRKIASGQRYGLVLTDHNMPGMSGFEFTTKLREQFGREEMAIIGLSATGNAHLSAQFIKYGANDFLSKPFLREEFLCRVSQNIDLVESFAALEDAAYRDQLTGLANRRYFLETGRRMLAGVQRSGQSAVVALLDADHFKLVNDTHGHDAGDVVLAGLSGILKERFGRESDLVGRLGGEEFGVLLTNCDGENAAVVLDAVRAEIAATPIPYEDTEIRISVSIGAASGLAGTVEEGLKTADRGLYAAKEAGRNRVVLC